MIYCCKTTFFQPVSLTSVCTDALKSSLTPAAVQRAERRDHVCGVQLRTGGTMQVNLSLHQQSLHRGPTRKKQTSKSQKKERKKNPIPTKIAKLTLKWAKLVKRSQAAVVCVCFVKISTQATSGLEYFLCCFLFETPRCLPDG